MTDPSEQPQIGTGYPAFQLAKALRTDEEHQDADGRDRARRKIAKWLDVIAGMLGGALRVGSRKPIGHAPVWATPEVVTGGFVTGKLLAGGTLADHEHRWLAEFGIAVREPEARRLLNSYFLCEDGFRKIQELLQSGQYEVGVPEEGALLVVAWLASQGYAEAARTVIDAIGEHFGTLRFYPMPSERRLRQEERVHLESVAAVAGRLEAAKPQPRVAAQKRAAQTRLPLYDEIIGLLLETVVGDAPTLARDANGELIRHGNSFQVEGGWPCQVYPDGWSARANEVLERHTLLTADTVRDRHQELELFLRRCLRDSRSLTGRDVGRIRLILAGFVAKRGAPGSEQCTQVRHRQRADAAAPLFADIAKTIAPRLSIYPQEGGIEEMAMTTRPITVEEVCLRGVPAGTVMPDCILQELERCRSDSIEVLVERGIVKSGETIARVVMQMTSHLGAAGFADPTLRLLYAAIYRAFRRRRSLLLLHLQSQVKIDELPWIAALEPFRRDDHAGKVAARDTLKGIVALTVRAFPEAIVPNKLLQELRALGEQAGLQLPLVDELAADIFMGQLTGKFVAAAKLAAGVLGNSLYQRYYAIDWREIIDLPEPEENAAATALGRWGSPQRLLRICERRAGVAYGGFKPAENGMIIEQQQILTTQNLAALVAVLDLHAPLRPHLPAMAQGCFRWICRRQQAKSTRWHAKLIMLKNTAYAWRQLVFFLSLLSQEQIDEFLPWAYDHFAEQTSEFQARFGPVLRGLQLAAAGGVLPDESPEGSRRFLGWTRGKHWLLARENDHAQPTGD